LAEREVSQERRRARSIAIRSLLVRPLLDGADQPEAFAAVVRERSWLGDWFDKTLGWPLHVDVRGGWARLSKRGQRPDASRAARRVRGARLPFDRRRYQLLCLACAELTTHPLTTIGILATSVASACATTDGIESFDSSRASERSALVDALKLLEQWRVVRFSAGDLESYLASEAGNALVEVDGHRLHRLVACARPPSSLEIDGADTAEVAEAIIDRLSHEPRYGEAATDPDDDARPLWLRHNVARRLIDDPVVYDDELSDAEREYAAHPSGRRWLLARAAEAGFIVEERREGRMAIDPDHIATDDRFPAPNSNAKQAALLLADRFSHVDEEGVRSLIAVSVADLEAHAREVLRRHKGWAKQYRGDGGDARLIDEALSVLERFGLVERARDRVRPRPALARYRAVLAEEVGQ
jgi:uncharacterized protein (TIGR02678 family)